MSHDLLDWIRAEVIARQPAALALIDPVLNRARQTFGGDTIYVRNPRKEPVSRRTVQRRLRQSPAKKGDGHQ